MLRVLHVRATHLISGPEKQLLGLMHEAGSGAVHHELLAIGREPDGNANPLFLEATKRGLICWYVRSRRASDFGPLIGLWRVARSRAVDVICTHGYVPDFIGYPVARVLSLPLIAVARGYTARNRKVRLYECVDRRLLRKFGHVVAVSGALRRDLESWGIRPERLSTIHNAIPLIATESKSEARARLGLPREGLLIGCVGRLSPEKGHAILLQAVAILAREKLDATAVICGDGPEKRNLEISRASLGIEDRVVLTGYVAGIESLLTAFEVFVLPSYSEGLPRALLEASAVGIPAVASAVGGIPELICGGKTGLLVPAGDPDALAEALKWLINDPSFAASIGREAQRRVMADFSVAAQVEQYEALFLRIHARWQERRRSRGR